jgi:hypothetical protein
MSSIIHPRNESMDEATFATSVPRLRTDDLEQQTTIALRLHCASAQKLSMAQQVR